LPLFLGIDIGSRNTKLVLLDNMNNRILYSGFCDTGVNPVQTVESLRREALKNVSSQDVSDMCIYATGYGRNMISSDKIVSEISCHAAGVLHQYPCARTIIDIGGQDCKVISLGEYGKVTDFVMNDKCAAGTGRFLEMVALRLQIPCSELDTTANKATQNLTLSSTCVVFAESEIIGLIALGYSAADIAHAVHLSIAERIIAQVNQLNWQEPVVFTGGVAFNRDLRRILSERMQCEILIPDEPELTGALGAALLARKDHAQD